MIQIKATGKVSGKGVNVSVKSAIERNSDKELYAEMCGILKGLFEIDGKSLILAIDELLTEKLKER